MRDRAGFSIKIVFAPKIGKRSQKQGFLNLLKIQSLIFTYCVSCTNPILWEIFVPEIGTKIFSANQIAEFFNQPYLQIKSIKWPDFLHVDRNSLKLKSQSKTFWAGIVKNVCGQSGHGTLKLTIYEKKQNKLIFYILVQIQENLKVTQ